jgi:hypothetical protein
MHGRCRDGWGPQADAELVALFNVSMCHLSFEEEKLFSHFPPKDNRTIDDETMANFPFPRALGRRWERRRLR